MRQAYARDEDGNKAPVLTITYTVPTTALFVMEIATNSISFFDSITTVNNVQTAAFTVAGEVDCANNFGVYRQPNLAPIALDDYTTMPSNTSATIPVQDNDTDPEGGVVVLLLDVNNMGNNGSVATKQDSISYQPNPNFTGQDTFNYVLCDFGTPSLCDTAMVLVTVENEAPLAMGEAINVESGVAIVVDILSNDSDKESANSQLDVAIIGTVQNGTAIIYPDGSIAYTSNTGFTGTETIQYEICDDDSPIKCDTASLTITVNPLMNLAPVAVDDYDTTNINQIFYVNVKNNDTDAQNDPLTCLLYTSPSPRD